MLNVLLAGAAIFVLLIAVLLVFAATKPDDFRVSRTIAVKAPPETIFAIINDLHQWCAWSPYEKKDPAMKRTFSGASAGQGAVYEWDGNKNVGTGRMEIVETTPPSKVLIKLDFFKPFEGHNMAEFTLEPQGGGTQVTWSMFGPSPYVAKVMGTVFNMDKIVGNDFEAGLVNLKTLAEQ